MIGYQSSKLMAKDLYRSLLPETAPSWLVVLSAIFAKLAKFL